MTSEPLFFPSIVQFKDCEWPCHFCPSVEFWFVENVVNNSGIKSPSSQCPRKVLKEPLSILEVMSMRPWLFTRPRISDLWEDQVQSTGIFNLFKLIKNFFNFKVGFLDMPGLSPSVWDAGVILDGNSLQQIPSWGLRNSMGFLVRILMPKLKFQKLVTLKKIPMMKQTRLVTSCRSSCYSLLSYL